MIEPLSPEDEAAFAAALELTADQRAAFLAREFDGNPELRAELESLLHAHDAATGFLEPPGMQPQRIGPYRVLEQIGAGGMGTVFRAVRTDQFWQEVAIKMIGTGMGTQPEFVQRFLAERQILANLAHPNVARLLDGGCTQAGAPYLVMEYVEGKPITEWCEERGATLEARLRLFRELCQGVQYAHQHLIVHRDLKPSNVLVTTDGTPKLLDFGIAKLLHSGADRTQTGSLAFSLSYASPEQVRGGPVTTASDVYSLGVVLYELLAGQRPYNLRDKPIEQAIDNICHSDPVPPSEKATGHIPEDIDAIVLKAMRKERAERYGSAKELADDIDRYLALRPVMARRVSGHYLLNKFVRRHRIGVVLGTALIATLWAAAVTIVWEAHVAREQRDQAQRRFEDVRHLARSVIFDLQNQLAAVPGTTLVRRQLTATALAYLDGLAKDVSTDRGLQYELGAAYVRIGDIQGNPNRENLGDLPGALQSYAKAEQIARKLMAEKPSEDSLTLLANVLRSRTDGYLALHDRAGAIRSSEEALRIGRERLKINPESEEAQSQLGAVLFDHWRVSRTGDLREATSAYEALLARKPQDPERQRNVALMHKYTANQLLNGNQSDGAWVHLQRAEDIDKQRVQHAPHDPTAKIDLAIDLSQLSEFFESKGNIPKAVEYAERSAAIRREMAAADPDNMRNQDRLAYILGRLGDLQVKTAPRKALANYRDSKASAEHLRTKALRLPHLAVSLAGMGVAYRKLGDVAASCSAYEQSLNPLRELLVSDDGYATKAAEAEKAYATCSQAVSVASH